jgi:beta-lactamase regulating signal transducer with metallopeptidase domain
MLANHAIAWMLTYLLHSTLLLGLAWLVSKPLSRWSVAAEESVWKLALVGALFTASLQFAAAGWEPLAGRWGLASMQAEPAISMSAAEIGKRAAATLPASAFRTEVPRVKVADAPASTPAPAFRMPSLPSMPSLALGVWALGAALLLAVYGSSFLRLRRWLRPRPRVIGGTLFSQLRMMALEAGFVEEIRLSCSSRVPVPLALGLRRGEICVPPRALAGLTAEQQEGMLAHELAHLARRDPFWLTVSHLVSSILFFQPLNWVARRRMREISEILSDEWAVSRTGRPLSLAGCLAEVAGWSVAPRALPVPGMADRPSHLSQRIRRLLDDTRSPERPARRWLLGTAMVALVIAVAAAAPAISAARPDAPKPEEAAALAALDAAAAPEPPAAEKRVPRTEVLPREDSEDDDDEDFDFEFDEEKFEKFEQDLERQFEKEFSKFDQEFEFEFEFPYEHDEEFEFEFDKEFEFDYEVDVDSIVAQAMASADAAMLGVGRGDARYEGRELTGEERERLAREIERTTREAQRISERVQRELAPKMDRLAREMSEKFNESHSAEMEKLAAEMSELGERMRPSPEEIARIQAQARKFHEDGVFSKEERERIGREARELAERMRPSEEDRKRMRELREEMMKERAEMRRKFMAEHRDEIERSQREMREEIERHMQGVREEVRRSMEQRRHELRENREDRERHREHIQDRERQHRREQVEERERERRREQIEQRQRERERRQELQRERLERDRDREDGDKDSSGPSI